MKVKVGLKSPDALEYAMDTIIVWNEDEDDTEDVEQTENEIEKFKCVARKWFEYGECLTVEIDTEEKSIRVLEV